MSPCACDLYNLAYHIWQGRPHGWCTANLFDWLTPPRGLIFVDHDFSFVIQRITWILCHHPGWPIDHVSSQRMVQEINVDQKISRFVPTDQKIEAQWVRVDFEPDCLSTIPMEIDPQLKEAHSLILLDADDDDWTAPDDWAGDLKASDVWISPWSFPFVRTPFIPMTFPSEQEPSPSPEDAGEAYRIKKILQNLEMAKVLKPPDPSHTREQSDFCSSIAAVQRLSPLRLMSRRKLMVARIFLVRLSVLQQGCSAWIRPLTFQTLLGMMMFLVKQIALR